VARFREVSVDTVREYWDARPCNLRHSSQPVGTKDYFDEVEARKYFVEPHIPRFAEFGRWKDKRVLEIGCGIGTDTINFARAGARVTAVELSPKSLALAKDRARLFGLQEKVDFVCVDAERLSEAVSPEPFDLVYSFGVIHHTPHPERVLEQIRTYFVGPESLLKVMVYHRWSWKAIAILLTEGHGAFWRFDEVIARNSEAQSGCPVTFTYSRAAARELLKGFKILEMWVDHVFPYRIPDYTQYRYVRNWYFRSLPTPWFRFLERHLGWHLCITASLA
jgi:SAM-dependent methyltransferase